LFGYELKVFIEIFYGMGDMNIIRFLELARIKYAKARMKVD